MGFKALEGTVALNKPAPEEGRGGGWLSPVELRPCAGLREVAAGGSVAGKA